MQAKNKGGRPRGRKFGVPMTIRFDDQDSADLEYLAALWGDPKAAVIRYLIRKGAESARGSVEASKSSPELDRREAGAG